jgi:hypothetical protein
MKLLPLSLRMEKGVTAGVTPSRSIFGWCSVPFFPRFAFVVARLRTETDVNVKTDRRIKRRIKIQSTICQSGDDGACLQLCIVDVPLSTKDASII